MVKNYAKVVRLVLERERERTYGTTFEAAWRVAMAQHPAPSDWTITSSDGTDALAYLHDLFALAYHGAGPETALSEDLLPAAKDPTPKVDDGQCRTPKCVEPRSDGKWCAEHGALLARVRAELEADRTPMSRHRVHGERWSAAA